MRPLLLALLLVLTACELPTFLEGHRAEVFGARSVEPLPEWEGWYQEAEECFDTPGNFDRVEWFVVDSINYTRTKGYVDAGLWRDGRIYVDRRYTGHRLTIVHESGHDLQGGDPGHRHPAWQTCGLLDESGAL